MKVKPSDIQRVKHMVDAITAIFEYTTDVSKEAFCKKGIILDAVIKNFQVLGEAAYHVTKDTRQIYDQVAWLKIAGLRHVLVHDYYEVDAEVLWNVKEDFLADLQNNLEIIIDTES